MMAIGGETPCRKTAMDSALRQNTKIADSFPSFTKEMTRIFAHRFEKSAH